MIQYTACSPDRRYRLSADVLRYPLVHKKPSLADEPEESDRDVIDGRHPAGQDGREMARIGGGPKSRGRTGDSDGAVDASQFVSALDKALPSSMLAHLQVTKPSTLLHRPRVTVAQRT